MGRSRESEAEMPPGRITPAVPIDAPLTTSAPGRVCLYGEHQDYLGLPVIAAAIDLRTSLTHRVLPSPDFEAVSADLSAEDRWSPGGPGPVPVTGVLRYLRAVTNELRESRGWRPPHGLRIEITSDIPVGAGLSSSAALLVSFGGALDARYGLSLSPGDVADLAYRAERVWCEVDCGQMDQYASALGGLIHLTPGPPPRDGSRVRARPLITRLPAVIEHLVVGDSRQSRAAHDALADRQQSLVRVMEKLGLSDFETIDRRTADDERLDETERERLRCVLTIRDLTRTARSELTSATPDVAALGRLLTAQHVELRDRLRVSTQKLDAMVEASIARGALGAKLTGAGLGGCMVALAPTRDACDRIAAAIEGVGARAWTTRLAGGLTTVASA